MDCSWCEGTHHSGHCALPASTQVPSFEPTYLSLLSYQECWLIDLHSCPFYRVTLGVHIRNELHQYPGNLFQSCPWDLAKTNLQSRSHLCTASSALFSFLLCLHPEKAQRNFHEAPIPMDSHLRPTGTVVDMQWLLARWWLYGYPGPGCIRNTRPIIYWTLRVTLRIKHMRTINGWAQVPGPALELLVWTMGQLTPCSIY